MHDTLHRLHHPPPRRRGSWHGLAIRTNRPVRTHSHAHAHAGPHCPSPVHPSPVHAAAHSTIHPASIHATPTSIHPSRSIHAAPIAAGSASIHPPAIASSVCAAPIHAAAIHPPAVHAAIAAILRAKHSRAAVGGAVLRPSVTSVASGRVVGRSLAVGGAVRAGSRVRASSCTSGNSPWGSLPRPAGRSGDCCRGGSGPNGSRCRPGGAGDLGKGAGTGIP
mmetsp:Transcript_27061/g.76297  ORF Transcript_27061/g.76297 Transcript_27061/m.76297 type:complete len:221 (+) Transcript_27061:514-1176(+)